MRLMRRKAQHAFAAKARRKAIDEISDVAFLRALPLEADLALRQSFGVEDAKADNVEAESRIERIGERLGLQAKEPQQRFDIARGRAGFETQGSDGAVGAKEARFKSAAAFAAPFENAHRFRDQRPQNILYRREIEKRLGEAPLDHAFRQGPQGRDARVFASQNAGQPPHGFVAKTRRQRGRGTIGEIAQVVRPARVSATLVSFGASSAAMESGRVKISSSPGGVTPSWPKRAKSARGVRRSGDGGAAGEGEARHRL